MQFPKPVRMLFIVLSAAFILACDISAFLPVGNARPNVVIQSPVSGATFKEGDEVPIQSTSSDPAGIVRVELLVDGQVVSSDAPPIPQGQVSFSLVQKWKATGGSHTLSVRAYNASGTGSDPASVSVEVAAGQQTALASPTAGSVNTPAPIASPPGAQPTNTSGAISTQPTATRRPNTPTPTRAAASPTSSAPPGVYAVSIRLDPPNPKVNQFVTFYVTFLNTTTETKHFKWYVKIYRDAPSSFGETARTDNDFPVGRVEFASASNWRVGGFADCQPFFARPFWLDTENNVPPTEFLKTDGQAVNQGFNVCP